MRACTRIGVVRALHGLGDMLCAVPALQALRRAHPQAHITLIGLPDGEWLLQRFGKVFDALMPFPGFPGVPEHPYSSDRLARFLRRVQQQPFDLAIQMHGSGVVTNVFTAMLGARSAAGLYLPGNFRPRPGRFFPYPQHGPEASRWLHLTTQLGCPNDGDALAFPVSAEDRAALRAHATLGNLVESRYVVIHPGARDPARRWPSDRFARVADALADQGYRIVLTGTVSERESACAVSAAMRADPVNAAGETSLGVAAALLERAALLVTNDTGISHLAAALRTPSVIVFVDSDPDRWAPPDRVLHRPVVARTLERSAPQGARRSRSAMPEPDEVLDEAFDLAQDVSRWRCRERAYAQGGAA